MKKVNLLIVGAGGRVAGFYDQRLVKGLLQLGQVNCADLTAQVIRVDKRFENDPQALRFTDLRVASASGPFDRVAVCVDISSHYEAMREMFGTDGILCDNSSVFLQKPIAKTIGQAEAIIKLAGKRNITLFVGDQHARQPAFADLAKRLEKTCVTPYEISINYFKNRGARIASNANQKPKDHPVLGVWEEEGHHIITMLLAVVPSLPLSIQALNVSMVPIRVNPCRKEDAERMELRLIDRGCDSWGEYFSYAIPGQVLLQIIGNGWSALVNASFVAPWQERSMVVQARDKKIGFSHPDYPNYFAGWRIDIASYQSGKAVVKPYLTEWSGPAYINAWSAAKTFSRKYVVGDLLGEEFRDFLSGNTSALLSGEKALAHMKISDAGIQAIKLAIRPKSTLRLGPVQKIGRAIKVNW